MTVNKTVPFLDLVTPHRDLEDELTSVFRSALHTAGFIGGPMVEQFEDEFATFCGVKHCVGVGSGTDALRFALVAAGVRPGDAVLTVPNTFIATTEAITQVGAAPEFVDVDENTANIDMAGLARFLEKDCRTDKLSQKPVSIRTGRTVTAVLPVHLYGQTADMDPLIELAETWNLTVIEDACQAHGAEYFSERKQCWERAGSIGRAAAFSFYPGKNLGACGEGGAVTTNDGTLAEKVRMLRDHGQARKYHHSMEGYNGRLDAIQAGILLAKLRYLSDWNGKRCAAAQRYNDLFAPYEHVITREAVSWARPVFHLYVIRNQQRDLLRAHLAEAGIDTGIHYPIPLHLQHAYRYLGYRDGDFPVAEQLAGESLSLPMFPTITREQQVYVANEMANFGLLHGKPIYCHREEKTLMHKASA